MRRSNRTTVTETKPSLMARLTGGRAGHMKTKTTTTTDARTGHTGTGAGHHHAAAAHTTGSTGIRKSPRTGGGVGGGLFSRKQPVVHQQRKVTTGDKVSGGLMKLKGTLTGRPGVKAAGTRRGGHRGLTDVVVIVLFD